MHLEWTVNEKVAFEIACAASQAGLRAVTAMKQVGLNVASGPLMSAAYPGTVGGFAVIGAGVPGPRPPQTEHDSRLMAMQAKVPVLDPSSPAEARETTGLPFRISEEFQVPPGPMRNVVGKCADPTGHHLRTFAHQLEVAKKSRKGLDYGK